MASFFRNTFDNLLNNISSTISPNTYSRNYQQPRTTSRPTNNNSTPRNNQNRARQQQFDRNRGPPPYSQHNPQNRNNNHSPGGFTDNIPRTTRQQARQAANMGSNAQQHHPQTNNIPNPAKNDEKFDIQDIRDPTEISGLSTRQLKTVLTRNCVDYRGVFEKEVLREKVMQLWIDFNERKARRKAHNTQSSGTNRSGDSSDDIDDNQLCKICMEREIDCVLLECGHFLTCVTCGRKLAECPICRQNITRCVRTFKG